MSILEVFLSFSVACKHCHPWLLNSSIALWGSCPATTHKNHKKFVTTVSLGEARILQAPDSDVSLSIPKGAPGIYFMTVYTDFSKSLTFFQNDECAVAPMVEVNTVGTPKVNTEGTPNRLFTLTIPHCVKSQKLWKFIKVNKYDKDYFAVSVKRLVFDLLQPQEEGFLVRKNFIKIHTKSFSHFVCTSCNKTCRAAILMFIFTKLSPWVDEAITTTDIKAFLCCDLYNIKDFKNVRAADCNIFCFCLVNTCTFCLTEQFANSQNIDFVFQELINEQTDLNMLLVGRDSVSITNENFSPEESWVRLAIGSSEREEVWEPEEEDERWDGTQFVEVNHSDIALGL